MKLLAATTLMIFSISAFATDATDASRLVSEAKMTLSEAITTAQANVAGVAVSADLDSHYGKTVYEVEILSGARLFDVRLNAADGSVISIKEDVN